MSGIDLQGKTALVTGASRGIGRAIALGYAQAGADLVLASRDEASLTRWPSRCRALGRAAHVIPTDVTDPEAVVRLVDGAVDRLGRVDVLVNNAGGTSFMVPFNDIRFSGWEKVFRLNVDSVARVCQAAGPHLVRQGHGSVINVASVAAFGGTPLMAPYGASKAAVLSLTRTLAMEWAHAGVRVNALCPGWTATDLNRNLWQDPAVGEKVVERVPMQRWGRAGGDGRAGGLPGQRRVVVRHRAGPGRRRRPDGGVAMAERPR